MCVFLSKCNTNICLCLCTELWCLHPWHGSFQPVCLQLFGMPKKVTWSNPNFFLFLLHFSVENHFFGQTVNFPSYNAQFWNWTWSPAPTHPFVLISEKMTNQKQRQRHWKLYKINKLGREMYSVWIEQHIFLRKCIVPSATVLNTQRQE